MAKRRTQTRTPFAATRAHLAQAMADIDAVLPGSIVIRHTRCGKPACACRADPPALHGPYIQWTRTVHGKTVTRLLTEDQLARYQPWFDNARRLKDLIAKLEAASLAAAAQAEGWPITGTREPANSSRPNRPQTR
jgi:hypothetical protein